MKTKVTFEIELEATRHEFYIDPDVARCRRCVFYTVCSAIQNLNERFPYSLVRVSELPCRQSVPAGERKYFKFQG